MHRMSLPKFRSHKGKYPIYIILIWEEVWTRQSLIHTRSSKFTPFTLVVMMQIFVESSTKFRYHSPQRTKMTSSAPKWPSCMIKIISSRKKRQPFKSRNSNRPARCSIHRVEDLASKFQESLKNHSQTKELTITVKVFTKRMESYAV